MSWLIAKRVEASAIHHRECLASKCDQPQARIEDAEIGGVGDGHRLPALAGADDHMDVTDGKVRHSSPSSRKLK
jgi:hypothetical protein